MERKAKILGNASSALMYVAEVQNSSSIFFFESPDRSLKCTSIIETKWNFFEKTQLIFRFGDHIIIRVDNIRRTQGS